VVNWNKRFEEFNLTFVSFQSSAIVSFINSPFRLF
jgi:hypothetical protein